MSATDWIDWHGRYDDPRSSLAQRLPVVRRLVADALEAAPRDVRVLSLCAGDGRDLLPALAALPPERSVRARLIELTRPLADAAAAFAAEHRLDGVEVVCADASLTDRYAGAVPADVVLACGIFGNVSDEDVRRTIEALPQLVSERGVVVWTRHRRAPDLTPAVRAWFAGAGFRELAFESGGEGSWAAGAHELTAPPQPLVPGRSLFTFV